MGWTTSSTTTASATARARTGTTPFEELQIIKLELFDMAQTLMTERTSENKEYRTLPLATNGKVCRQADGTPVKKKRIRYVCSNKPRHRATCDGQTGYTMRILDDIVADILHQVFDKMKSALFGVIGKEAERPRTITAPPQ